MHRFNYWLIILNIKEYDIVLFNKWFDIGTVFVRGQSYWPQANKEFQYQISY